MLKKTRLSNRFSPKFEENAQWRMGTKSNALMAWRSVDWYQKRLISNQCKYFFEKYILLTKIALITGKSMSEALILESVNPQYDDRLLIDLRLQYKKNTSSEHVVYQNCFECQNKSKKQFLYTTCSEHVFFGEFNEQSLVILWVNWCKNKGFRKRFTCTELRSCVLWGILSWVSFDEFEAWFSRKFWFAVSFEVDDNFWRFFVELHLFLPTFWFDLNFGSSSLLSKSVISIHELSEAFDEHDSLFEPS